MKSMDANRAGTWEFLLQCKGDPAWMPLAADRLALVEGKYRIALYKPDTVGAEVDVRVTFVDLSANPPKCRSDRRHCRTDIHGMALVIPPTHLKPGRWEIRCYSDLLAELSGAAWRKDVCLEVTPSFEIAAEADAEAIVERALVEEAFGDPGDREFDDGAIEPEVVPAAAIDFDFSPPLVFNSELAADASPDSSEIPADFNFDRVVAPPEAAPAPDIEVAIAASQPTAADPMLAESGEPSVPIAIEPEPEERIPATDCPAEPATDAGNPNPHDLASQQPIPAFLEARSADTAIDCVRSDTAENATGAIEEDSSSPDAIVAETSDDLPTAPDPRPVELRSQILAHLDDFLDRTLSPLEVATDADRSVLPPKLDATRPRSDSALERPRSAPQLPSFLPSSRTNLRTRVAQLLNERLAEDLADDDPGPRSAEFSPNQVARSALQLLPSPHLEMPLDPIAGQPTRVRICLPAASEADAVKLWLLDGNSDLLLDEPQKISQFTPNRRGDREAVVQFTIPFGCLVARLEAIAIQNSSDRASMKTAIERCVNLPDIHRVRAVGMS